MTSSAQTETSALPADAPSERPPVPFLCRRPVRVTVYLLLGLFLAGMLTWRFLPTYLDPTFEKHIAEKRVVVGMTRQQVLKAWGTPYTVNVSYTKEGIRREEWIYEDWLDAKTVKHRYLYFEEDALVGGWF